MGVLQRFERRLGGLVEGAFARVFKGGVEPVELAGALTRECDEHRARSAKRTLVPNEFVIHLSDPDFQRLAPYRQALGAELATLVREHAAQQRYTFVAPVVVTLQQDSMLSVGRYEIRSGVAGEPAQRDARGAIPGSQQVPQPVLPQPPLPPQPPAAVRPHSSFSRPTNPTAGAPELPRLVVSVGGSAAAGTAAASGHELNVPLDRPLMVIGRGSDVDVQLADTGVSRQHGEVLLQPTGRHVYRDLGSTNGSTVNGRKVREVPLVDGDRIEVGRSVLVYRDPSSPRPGGPGEGRGGGEMPGRPAGA